MAEQDGQRGAINRQNSRTSRPDRPRACAPVPNLPASSAADGTAMAASGVSIDITGCMTALDAEGREFVVSTNNAPQLWSFSARGDGRPRRRSKARVRPQGEGPPLRRPVAARRERPLARRDVLSLNRTTRAGLSPRLSGPWRRPRRGSVWHGGVLEGLSALACRAPAPSRVRGEWLTTTASAWARRPHRVARRPALPPPPPGPAKQHPVPPRAGKLGPLGYGEALRPTRPGWLQLVPKHALSRGLSRSRTSACPPPFTRGHAKSPL